jgi:DNA-binding NarL/FixJ family response regulator
MHGNRPSHYETRFQWTLTPQQQQVAGLISSGHTDAQIATALGLSLDGAKYHVKEILRKRRVSSRQSATAA